MSKGQQESFIFTVKEMDRLSVVQTVIKKKITWKEAAEELRLSIRQIGRLICSRSQYYFEPLMPPILMQCERRAL